MESKKWIWIVVVCLAIAIVCQVAKIANVEPTGPQGPGKEPALQPDQTTTQTASLAGLSNMPEQKTPPTIEPAKVEEPKQVDSAAEPEREDSAPMPEEQSQETEEPAEEQNPPSPETEQPHEDGGASPTVQTAATAAVAVAPSNNGLVRGIVYSADSGSALIDDTIVQAGDTIDGVKVVTIHADGVNFEKNGQRWTQEVSEKPNPQWQ